ncbi:MAG: hypothetical protein ACRDJO_13700 [Actinomycetota bacterium]
MLRGRRSALAGLGMGLAALTTAAAVAAPDPAPRPEPARHEAPVAPADPGCQVVDANGVPLVDSQYLQRTGHPPC